MGKKSVNNLYKPMLEHSNVEQKFHKAAKGKTERPDVAVILEPTNIQRHVKNVVEQLENTAPEGYDIPHPEKAWKPSRHGKVCINEGTSRKEKRETTRFHGIPVLSRQDDSAGKHHVELHTESQPCRKERENHMVRCNRNSVIHGLLEQYRHIRHVPAKGQALCEC